MIPTLEGEHVRLEGLSPAHAPALLRASQGHASAFRWTSVPQTLADVEAYIAAALKMHASNGALPFATVRKSDERVMGSTRLANLEFWAWPKGSPHWRPEDRPDAAEIGWTWLTPEAQRTALNTEAKLLMLSHAFEVWRVHRVTLKTDERNAQSRANIERVGGKLDGILRAHMPTGDGQGVRNSAVYSILASEWPAARARLESSLRAGR